jgi:hypothetical protein
VKQAFNVGIKIVFLLAFAAFLYASINHIATFFHQFEPANSDLAGSYFIAIAVDGTSLMLTIGMMFFAEDMPLYAKFFVWFFIFLLTGFSWLVNWEYAVVNQTSSWSSHLDPFWLNVDPIMASSFAFLNLAYSVVAEFFGSKQATMEELQAQLNALQGRAELEQKIKEAKGPSLIQQAKERAMEVKEAVSDVIAKEQKSELPANTDANIIVPSTEPTTKQIKHDLFTGSEQISKHSSEQNLFAPTKQFDDDLANTPVNEDVYQSEQVIEQISEQFLFDDANIFIDTGENESVNNSVYSDQTPKPRITKPLSKQVSELPSEQTRDTDKLAPINKSVRSNKQTANTEAVGDAAKRVLRLLQKNKNINVTELAAKAKVSKGYASQVRTDFMKRSVSA